MDGVTYMFLVNHLTRDGLSRAEGRRQTGHLAHVGLFATQVPWTLLRCRLLGHKAVVDGTEGFRDGDLGARWVCCGRCGLRGSPQGSLDPRVHAVGDRYLGSWLEKPPDPDSRAGFAALKDLGRGFYPPGRFPAGNTGELGAEICVGKAYGGVGFELKVGNGGSEHVLAAGLYLGVASLHLHTSGGIGRCTQRLLNPAGYHSRLVGLRFTQGTFVWRLWAKRDACRSERNAWWQHFELQPRPLDRVFGRRRYQYTDVGPKISRIVRLPERDYLVELQLQRCVLGRDRWTRKKVSWSVDWSAPGRGIPSKPGDRGRVFGSAVTVSEQAVRAGTWPEAAVAAIAVRAAEYRTHEDWDATGAVKVEVPS